jgi:hypothetical protein
MRPPRPGTSLVLLVPAAGLVFAACQPQQETIRQDFPRLELSTEMVEFNAVEQGGSTARTVWLSNLGDLPMGINAIETTGTNDQSDPHFSVSYSSNEIQCPESADTAEAEGKGFGIDSGQPEDTGNGGGDTGGGGGEDGDVIVLNADCRIPVQVRFAPEALGTLWGSLIVRTGTEQVGDDATKDPSYYSDPVHAKRLVYLVGEGERGIANVMVRPRRFDYGHLWTGTQETAYIAIKNAGDGDLTVNEPYLDGCPETFEITGMGLTGAYAVLEPGISTYVEVTYTPESTDAASCTMIIESDDEDSPRIDVDFEANTGVDPENVPPTVTIRTPTVGHQWSGGEADSLQLELNIFDLNQPADSLTCRVKSMVLADGASVAHCEADDESGHVYVNVPYEYVDTGVDTIKVQVTDASEIISYASISVLWNAGFPESDDDGDGWGDEADADEDGNYDCDDLDINTYPFAAEIADGKDNDCDGVADEGTRAYDDDGDSFSENEGDCNDYDEDVYAGAWEIADYKDNDCDGVADEGTSLYDDDGDGYTEMDLDCDDTDESVHPGAVEYCDGIDNDCNGLRDYSDGCVEIDSEPYVVGGINLQQTACEPGDAIMASVHAYDADGQSLEYAWSGDEGLVIEPLTGSPSVTITCPEPSNKSGSVLGLSVYITDEDRNPVWDFDEMWVYPQGDLYRQFVEIVYDQGSCASAAALPALSLAWLALVGAAIRRRRED